MIHKAKKEDANYIDELIYLASGETIDSYLIKLSKFNNKNLMKSYSKKLMRAIFEQEDTILSYKNCLVSKNQNEISGIIISYSSEIANNLRNSTNLFLKKHDDIEHDIYEQEVFDDSLYIDTLAVLPQHRGQGIAKKLLAVCEKKALESGFTKMSLLVSLDKLKAKKLYEKFGFIEHKQIEAYSCKYIFMIKNLKIV